MTLLTRKIAINIPKVKTDTAFDIQKITTVIDCY